MYDLNNEFHRLVKTQHKDLYWNIIGLLQDLQTGGTSLRWVCNMNDADLKMVKNFEKALDHINIATDILRETLYTEENE